MDFRFTLKIGLPLFVLTQSGCASVMGQFGYYKHPPAPRAAPDEAERVQFPDSLQEGVQLSGPMMSALKVAMEEYRPPSLQLKTLDTPEDRCLARWEHIRSTVQQANDNLFFVRFTPDIRDCAPGVILLDGGATYAVDRQGRVLAVE